MTTFLDGFYKAKDTWFPVMKVTPNTVTPNTVSFAVELMTVSGGGWEAQLQGPGRDRVPLQDRIRRFWYEK